MCVAVAAVGIAIVGTAVSLSAQESMEDAQYEQAQQQKNIQNEQKAANAAQSAAERRRQIREERIKKARVMQGATNTGTSGSSGEFGALGSLSTQLSSNIGTNLGSLQTANNISIFSQASADAGTTAQQFGNESQMWQQIGGLSGSVLALKK
jgi:hypothetical protein